MTTRILIDMPVHEARLSELKSIEGVHLDLLPPNEVSPEARAVEVAPELLAGAELLLCTYPPQGFEAMTKLRFVQIGSSGY
ncbi:MAG: hypothetical protein ABIZ80_06845, partial [Bryobacteraceae bacterium]